MGTTAMRLLPVRFLIGFAMLASLVCAAGAYAAVGGLPPGVQVNNDPPAIDPGQDAGLTDLTAGTRDGRQCSRAVGDVLAEER